MPTSYTYNIKDGISFNKFILNCARAFGATLDMREESLDVEIPQKFDVSTYHSEQLVEAKKDLKKIKAMTVAEADIESKKDYKKAVKNDEEYIKEKEDLKIKYEAMLVKAKAWVPPTKEHYGLKDFMIKQLEESIDYDCGMKYHDTPKLSSGKAWLDLRVKSAKENVKYHTEHQKIEVDKNDERNKWVSDLRKSLTKSDKDV